MRNEYLITLARLKADQAVAFNERSTGDDVTPDFIR